MMNMSYRSLLVKPLKLVSPLHVRVSTIAARNYHFDLLNLKIGYTKTVENHPESDKLYVSQVELDQADGVKQICSGLRGYVSREFLQGRLVVVVDNMKKCKLRGQVSEAMILCGENASESKVTPCTLAKFDTSLVGKSVVLRSAGEPTSEPTTRRIKPKEWEDIFSRLRVGDNGKITYREEGSADETYLCVYDSDGQPVSVIVENLPAGSAIK